MHAAAQTSRSDSRPDAQDNRADARSPVQTASTPAAEGSNTPGDVTSDVPSAACTEDEIRTALTNTLESSEFRSAPQLRSFLEFVVHASLENRPEKIKGYTIAVEALGRAADFNPVTDPIVRVEAARLRRRLTQYYEGSGASDLIRITIPKGSYAPAFTSAAHAEASDVPTENQEADTGDEQPSHAPLDEQSIAAGSLSDEGLSADQASLVLGTTNASAAPAASSNFSQTQSETPLQRLVRKQVSLPIALALAIAGFLAGFLAGS